MVLDKARGSAARAFASAHTSSARSTPRRDHDPKLTAAAKAHATAGREEEALRAWIQDVLEIAEPAVDFSVGLAPRYPMTADMLLTARRSP